MAASATERAWHAEIDTKEQRNHDIWFDDSALADSLPGTLAREGFSYSFAPRKYGDFRITSRARPFDPALLVESKTWDDLHASLRDSGAGRADSRLRHQLAGLLDAQAKGDLAALLVVGTMTKAGGKQKAGVYVQNKGRRQHRRWSYYEMEQAVAAIQRLGILVYRAPSEHEVPASLRHLAELCARNEHFQPPGLPQLASLAPRLGFLATVLTAVPGMSKNRALPIAMKYKTFPAFFDIEVKELQEFEGIGKVLAQRVHDHFHGDVPDVPSDLSPMELGALT
jgi:ERCC4-type nuclease